MNKNKIFIDKAKLVHGTTYDYSKVDYVNNKTKVTIICPIHKEFEQAPSNHLAGKKCKKCSNIISSDKQKITTKEFIEKVEPTFVCKILANTSNTQISLILFKSLISS